MVNITYQPGLPDEQRNAAAKLYDEAFGAKFSLAVPNQEKRVALLTHCFMPEYAITAMVDETLVGLAGVHTAAGSLTGGINFSGLLKQLGIFAGLRAALIFSFYERKLKPDELLMDGIAVHAKYRGHGIGTALLEQVKQYGLKHGYQQVRLDVIDTNPKAKKLYEKQGFEATHTDNFQALKWLLGFGASTTMVLRLVD